MIRIITVIFINSIFISHAYRVNIAQGRPTKQSTTRKGADLAVDDHIYPDWYNRELWCTETWDSNTHQWWAVDLGKTYNITNIVIYGRRNCCVYRFGHFGVYVIQPKKACDSWTTVFDTGEAILCHYQVETTTFVNITCPLNTEGQYIRILKNDLHRLTICELQAYGELPSLKQGSRIDGRPSCRIPGQTYNGNFIESLKAMSSIECVARCFIRDDCYVAEFKKTINECVLKSMKYRWEGQMYADVQTTTFVKG